MLEDLGPAAWFFSKESIYSNILPRKHRRQVLAVEAFFDPHLSIPSRFPFSQDFTHVLYEYLVSGSICPWPIAAFHMSLPSIIGSCIVFPSHIDIFLRIGILRQGLLLDMRTIRADSSNTRLFRLTDVELITVFSTWVTFQFHCFISIKSAPLSAQALLVEPCLNEALRRVDGSDFFAVTL